MKVVLTRSLWIENKLYPAGEQEIAENILKSKSFGKHIKAGHVIEAKQVRKVAVKSEKERADALLEKLHSKQVADASPEEAASLPDGVKSADADAASGTAPVENSKPSKKR